MQSYSQQNRTVGTYANGNFTLAVTVQSTSSLYQNYICPFINFSGTLNSISITDGSPTDTSKIAYLMFVGVSDRGESSTFGLFLEKTIDVNGNTIYKILSQAQLDSEEELYNNDPTNAKLLGWTCKNVDGCSGCDPFKNDSGQVVGCNCPNSSVLYCQFNRSGGQPFPWGPLGGILAAILALL